MHTEIGKIDSVTFGNCGYQNAQLGFQIHVSGKAWGTTFTYIGGWGHVSEEELNEPTSSYKWTHEKRIAGLGKVAWEVYQLMKAAKVTTLDQLVGKPIRAHFENAFGNNTKLEILEDCV